MLKRTSDFLKGRSKDKEDLNKPVDDERVEMIKGDKYFYYVIDFNTLDELKVFIDNLDTKEVVINMKDVILDEPYIEIYDTYRE